MFDVADCDIKLRHDLPLRPEIVIPGLPVRAEPGIQTAIRRGYWIPGQARNDGTVIPAYAGIQ
jgi:hypothetical protein